MNLCTYQPPPPPKKALPFSYAWVVTFSHFLSSRKNHENIIKCTAILCSQEQNRISDPQNLLLLSTSILNFKQKKYTFSFTVYNFHNCIYFLRSSRDWRWGSTTSALASVCISIKVVHTRSHSRFYSLKQCCLLFLLAPQDSYFDDISFGVSEFK